MEEICRFCLKVSDQNMMKLHKESDVLCKIQSSLSLQIQIQESFPNQFCKECENKITQVYEFYLKIKESEERLQDYLLNGSSQDFYLKLSNNVDIKEENDRLIFCESKYIKNEDLTRDVNINKKEDSKYDEFIENDDVKNDDIDNIETPHNSDDEISLSSTKPRRRKKNTLPQKAIDTETQNGIDTNSEAIKQFTCLTCLKLCDSHSDLIKHYHEEHMHKSEQKYSVEDSGNNMIYKCNGCEKFCDNIEDIEKHLVVHYDERPLICKICGRMYKTVTEIIRHARAHNGFKLQCSYKCGYSTAYRGALKEHENRHSDVYKYSCEKCGKGFHAKTWYEQHQNIHNGLKPFSCQLCGLAFHMARYLTAHKSSMHPQTSSVKRYVCVHCNQKCDSANSLALHLEKHGINKEKEFLCDFCGKILTSGDQLKYHHRMHSGVKPYSCSICNKTFAKKFNVKVHMSSHSSEKSHACTVCGKRYTQRSTLLRHLRRHHAGTSPIHP